MKLVQSLQEHTACVWHAAWSHTSDLLATCGADKSVRVWGKDAKGSADLPAAAQLQCKETMDGCATRSMRCCEWSRCGRYLAAVSFDASVLVWELEAGAMEPLASLEGHENEVKSIAWNAAGTLIATCARDKTVWLWDADAEADFECVSVLPGHGGDVKSVQWHPTEDVLLSCSYDNSMRVWKDDGDDWVTTQVLEGHSTTVWEASFSPDGNQLASVDGDGCVIIWQLLQSGVYKEVSRIPAAHEGPAYSAAWCPHGSGVLATAGADDSIALHRTGCSAEGGAAAPWSTVMRQEGAHQGDVNCVRWHPREAGLLVSTGDDGRVITWVVATELL